MFKEEGRWWTRIDGTKTSCGNGHFLDVLIYAIQRKYLRKILSPVLCFMTGHQYSDQGMGYYVCSCCGKDY